jgi:FixJ family two-component response regulator
VGDVGKMNSTGQCSVAAKRFIVGEELSDRSVRVARDCGAPHRQPHAARRQIMEQLLAGQPSKIIAANLGISQRTVENHRAAIMKRTGRPRLVQRDDE